MMPADWLDVLPGLLATGQDAVIVTVARCEGSAPREAGATMLVHGAGQVATIGGGHLEWEAVAQARRRLHTGKAQPELLRYALRASLGQCCGGVVWLLFETLPAAAAERWAAFRASRAAGQVLRRRVAAGEAASHWAITDAAGAAPHLSGNLAGWLFVQQFGGRHFPVHVFGAGHVGQALVNCLRPLGARLTWVDSRDDAFAGIDTRGLTALVTDTPESELAAAPAGSCFVILTHSHALDFALCEAAFRRRDFAYLGLIGSRSKRASFEHRLRDRGLPAARLAELTCPIGIPGIVGKEPAAIGLAVAAELLQIHHARELLSQVGRPRLIDNPVQPE